MRIFKMAITCLALNLLPLPLGAQTILPIQEKPTPTEFDARIGVVGAELLEQWQGLNGALNVPSLRSQANPGQRLMVAVLARGKDRDKLIQEASYSFSLGTKAFPNVHPVLVRRLKAEGADMVKTALAAGKVATDPHLEDMLSMVSVAVFDLGWSIPAGAKDGALHIKGNIRSDGKSITLTEAILQVQSFETSVQNGDFKDVGAMGEWVTNYYQHPEPARILNAFRTICGEDNAYAFNIRTLFVEVLRTSPEAAHYVLGRLKGEEVAPRMYGLQILQDAKVDVSKALSAMPEWERTVWHTGSAQVPPLPDPYDLTIHVEEPMGVSRRLDMLWMVFAATGNPRPVRAIASVLDWKNEGMTFYENQKAGKKIEKVTPEVLRGLAYKVGGWSLGSFQRNHPLVADFIEAWKQDPTVPEVVKTELGGLATNPAFKN